MKEFYKGKIKDLLRPGYYFCKDIFDLQGRKRLKKNIILKDYYRGKRAFLLLTGASLQQLDINKLKDEYTLGVGFIFLHKDIEEINLNFYMSVEPSKSLKPSNPNWPKSHLGPLGHEGIVQFYKAVDKAFTDKTILIFNSDNYKYIEINNLFKDKKKYFVKGKSDLHLFKGKEYKIIVDLTKRFTGGGGSVFNSILILIYMGFKEIYLCGAGYTYNPRYVLHFYDNYVFPTNVGRKKAILEAKGVVASHNKKHNSNMKFHGLWEKNGLFHGIYITAFCKKDPDTLNHIIMNEYARSLGVNIINIVPEGFESPIYEKISWKEVVDNVLPNQPKHA